MKKLFIVYPIRHQDDYLPVAQMVIAESREEAFGYWTGESNQPLELIELAIPIAQSAACGHSTDLRVESGHSQTAVFNPDVLFHERWELDTKDNTVKPIR